MYESSRAIVFDRVVRRIVEGQRNIDIETYEQFFDAVADVLEDLIARMGELSTLRRVTYEKRLYGGAYELEGFDIGACWGAVKVVEAVVGGVVSPSCDCFLQEHDIFTSYAVLPPERSRVLVVAQRHDSAIADYASVPRSLVKQVLVEVCWYSS